MINFLSFLYYYYIMYLKFLLNKVLFLDIVIIPILVYIFLFKIDILKL